MKNKNKQPIDILRAKRRVLDAACKVGEKNLGQQWNYLSDNVGGLLISSATNSVKKKLGFGHTANKVDKIDNFATSGSFSSQLVSGFMASAPMLWEIAQPLIIKSIINKIKSFIAGDNKDEKDDVVRDKPKLKKKPSSWW